MNVTYLFPYLTALLLTIIIEGLLCWFFFKTPGWLRFTCLVNLFTNPLANALYTIFYLLVTVSRTTLFLFLLLLELAVWLFEAWLFSLYAVRQKNVTASAKEKPAFAGGFFTRRCALLFSLCLNAASCLAGVVLQL